MKVILKQISSLEKVRQEDKLNYTEIKKKTVFTGQRYSYQIAVLPSEISTFNSRLLRISVESPLKEYIKLYIVKNAVMDYPAYSFCEDEHYITKTPGLMPDILIPIEDTNSIMSINNELAGAVWVRVDIPENYPKGEYEIIVKFKATDPAFDNNDASMAEIFEAETHMHLVVLGKNLPKQDILYTQWFYTDCIAQAHNVEIYSDKHWELIDRYMQVASEIGINTLLMPVVTPPLDTMYMTSRPCVQLVDIEKRDAGYNFDFSKVKRWIQLCKKNGIMYYEISHLYTQWGSEYAPNIFITENGVKKHMFGWHTKADSKEYTDFLNCLIPELIEVLKDEKIDGNTYFHIADEPKEKHLEAYSKAYNVIRPLIGDIKTFDAISSVSFYKEGLIDCPITITTEIEPFLKCNIDNQWAYYCCSEHERVSNRFLAMPSYRNRIIGLQLYKFGIKGFLHWGFNYYNSVCSTYTINPFQTTSADCSFPSGDAFSVYPGKDGALLSIRALVFYEALEDIRACKLLEKYIGKDAVVDLIEKEAGQTLDFGHYPHSADYILSLREKITNEISKYL